MATKVSKGVTTSEVFNPDLIPQAEAEAGTATTERLISAQRMNQAIVALTVAGDVDGPASATDNALPRFDGVTGKLIQGSGALLDDSDNLSAINELTISNASNDAMPIFNTLSNDITTGILNG